MPLERISGHTDPRVAPYRDFSDAALLESHGLFVAEGRLVLRRLIEERRYTIRSVLVNEATARSLAAELASIDDRVPVYLCDTSDFAGVTGHHIHRGCLAIVERPPARSLADIVFPPLFPGAADGGSIVPVPQTNPAAPDPAPDRDCAVLPQLIVVLEGVTNADNVGGAFRNAAAFGASAVLLSPTCCDPLYRKAIRTSMAATLRVPYARLERWPADLQRLRAGGFTIVALTPHQPSLTLDEFAATVRPRHIALLVGTEGDGLTAAAESCADYRVRIPIAPAVDSVNLAVAVGIALYRLRA